MSESNTKREHDKIRELARDYAKKGFKVLVNPRADSLPSFLRDFQYSPDLIVTSESERYVIEVASRDTAERLRELSPIVDVIEDAQGWEFLLVMTNPRKPAAPRLTALRLDEIQAPLEHVRSLAAISADTGHKYDHAVVLAAWAVIEAALRMYLYSDKPERLRRTTRSIIRDSVMYGFIDARDGQFLDSVADLRNAIAHGALTAKVPEKTVRRIVALCVSLAKELRANRGSEGA